jgi:hypothetical protein
VEHSNDLISHGIVIKAYKRKIFTELFAWVGHSNVIVLRQEEETEEKLLEEVVW